MRTMTSLFSPSTFTPLDAHRMPPDFSPEHYYSSPSDVHGFYDSHGPHFFKAPQSSIFSLRGLRKALPFLGQARQTAPPAHHPSTIGYNDHDLRPMSPTTTPFYGSATAINSTASLPQLQMSNRIDSQDRDHHLIHPADNLNLYLCKAVIEKWTYWIDPALKASMMLQHGRWQMGALWGSGTLPTRESRGRRGSQTGFGEFPDPKQMTIQRLVQSVMGYIDDTTGSPERVLKKWLPRKGFFRSVEECELLANICLTACDTDADGS